MEKKNPENIQIITDAALCSACGGCAGICPVDAITMSENAAGFIRAVVDDEKCIKCHKCIHICPSNGTRLSDDLKGSSLGGYIGFASDSAIRVQGQSGGIVTAVLQFMLASGLIDAVVVTRFNCNRRRAESFLARSTDEIYAARGSHYTQTSPVEIILENQNKKLAAVLLGCQSACLDQISKIYPKVRLPILTIGLICGGNLSGYMVDDLMGQAKIRDKKQVTGFRFRDKEHGGWPGDIVIHADKTICIPKERRMELKPYYQNYRCLVCADKMNQHCDIVVGDPWGIDISDETAGYTAVITRSEIGENVLKSAQKNGIIFLQEESIDRIVEGQMIESDLKERLSKSDGILAKYKWPSPYYMQNDQKNKIPQNCNKAVENKLLYARKLYFSESKEEAFRLINQKKKEAYHPVREFLYKVKKQILSLFV